MFDALPPIHFYVQNYDRIPSNLFFSNKSYDWKPATKLYNDWQRKLRESPARSKQLSLK